MSKKFNKNIQYTFNPQLILPTSSVLTITGNSNTIGSIFTTGGNVGIGTTSPSTNLEISSSGVTKLRIQGDSLNNAAFDDGRTQCQLQFRTEGGFDNGFDLNTQNWTGTSSFMINEVRGSTGSLNTFTRLCIDTSGNVGIGTSVPAYSLDVNGTIDATTYTGGIVSATNVSTTSLTSGNAVFTTGATTGTIRVTGVVSATNVSTTSLISTNITTSTINSQTWMSTPYIVISQNLVATGNSNTIGNIFTTGGNVGIGTTSPVEKLDVSGNLCLGNSTQSNYIVFFGTNGDSDSNHTYIGERIFNPTEQSELLLFKGNDVTSGGGPDRIRLLAAEHRFDTFTTSSILAGTFENIATHGSTRMIITTAGNVGIGTTNPLYSLQVDGNVALNVMPAINSVGSIKIGRQDFNARWHMINCNNGTAASLNTMIFNLHDAVTSTSNTPVLALRGDGRVGINVTAPAYALDVNGTIDASIYTGGSIAVTGITTGTLRLTSMTATNILISGNVDAGGQFLGQANDSVTSASFSWTGDTNTGIYRPLADTIGFVTNGVDRFRLASNGNLLMAGAANNNYGINMPTGGYGIHWQTGTGGVSRIYDDGDLRICTDDNMRFYTGSSSSTPGTERMTLNSTGIGIGTNGQVSTLCLNGNATGNGVLHVVSISSTINNGRSQDGASFRAWNDGNIIIDFYNSAGTSRGTIYGNGSGAVTYNTSSDRRLKKDVINMSSAINLIKQMRPIEFTWISDNKIDFGFIAQEIYELFPKMRPNFSSYSHCECDTTDISNGILCSCEEHNHDEPLDKDGNPLYYGLDYGRFTPYLTKALQETISELETSQQTIQSQAIIISQLQAQISSQQQQINDILTRLS